ncbi:MAG: hypothetical protein JWO36_3154 [Myxococcales bacterium]|nr:hypothetical protein [Myxococcales bacterium]
MLARVTICVALAACSKPADETPDAAATIDATVDVAVDAPVVVLPACTTPGSATYTMDPGHVIAPDLVGFGAQYNANAYAAISAAAGITPQNVIEMEDKTIAMRPQHVRVFWSSTATPDQVESFERTITLAERSGASVNVTYWHGPYPDPAGQMTAFSNELVRLIHDLGHDAVREITIQNEVSSTLVTQPLYEQLYRNLDQDLRTAGIRDHIKFVCGDLLRTNQASWFDYLATHMTDVCDAYSVHIYWNYFDVPYMVTRVTEVHDIVAAMPASARKPIYVTEFGVRGNSPNGEADPGLYSDGQLLERTNENAFQHAWFNVLATRLGFVSTLKWDAFYAKYDQGSQFYSAIGAPPEWFVKPVYYATQLFTSSVAPGWSSVGVTGGTGAADTRLLTGFSGPNGAAAVVALNKGRAATTVDVTGLPPGTPVQLLVWHGEGAGNLTTRTVTTTDQCQITFTVPARSVAAVTTLVPSP